MPYLCSTKTKNKMLNHLILTTMKRNILLPVVIMVAMMMASVNVNAQGRGRSHAGNYARHEMVMGGHGANALHNTRSHVVVGGPVHHRTGHVVYAGAPRIDHRGYLPGWEGRVRYLDGRWGYLRGSEWFWYDTYFEPEYYFAHRPHHFRAHYIPVDGRVVAGVAGAVALGTLIGALCH